MEHWTDILEFPRMFGQVLQKTSRKS